MVVPIARTPPTFNAPGLHQLAQRPIEGITHDHRNLTVPYNLTGTLKPATLRDYVENIQVL